MTTADEVRELVESWHMFGLAINNPRWHSLAERLLRHLAPSRDEVSDRQAEDEAAITDNASRRHSDRKAA